MPDNRALSIVLACIVVVGFAIAPASAGAATPSDVQPDADTDAQLSALYHGNVTIAGAPPGQEVEVSVLTDTNNDNQREVVDSLLSDTDGQFGGPGASDAKLEVTASETTDEVVAFNVGGTPAEIVSYVDESGNEVQVNDNTIDWNDGDIRDLTLEADEDALNGYSEFTVDITDSPASIGAGDPATVNATIENVGNATGTQQLTLGVDQGVGEVDNTTRTISPGETAEISLTWDTTVNDAGERELTVSSEDQSASTTVTVEEAVADVTFEDQATASSTITNGQTDAGVQVDLNTNVNGQVLITYEDGGDLVVAGTASFAPGDETAVVDIVSTSGFPGNHTAHTVRTDDLSSTYAPGDTISEETAAAIIDSDTASVVQSTVEFSNQAYNDSTDELTVDTASVLDGAADDTRFVVNVHPTDENGDLIASEYVGSSAVLAGDNTDVSIPLQDAAGNDVTIEDTDDVVAMVHIVDDDTPVGEAVTPGTFPVLPNADGTDGFVAGGVTDQATVTINDSPFFEVTDLRPDQQTVVAGSNTGASANISNIGDFAATQNITLTVENESGAVIEERIIDERTLAANSDAERVGAGFSLPEAGEYTYTIASENDSATGTATAVAEAEGSVTVGEQATNSTAAQFNGDRTFPAVVAENVSANVDTIVFTTYEENGDTIVNGVRSFNASELDQSDVTIPIQGNATPGNHTVHVIPDTEVSSETADAVFNGEFGGLISADTADAAVATDTAPILKGTVALDDADQVGGAIDEVTVSQADLLDGTADDTEFVVVVHPVADDGTIGAPVGNSSVLTGTNSDITVALDEPVDTRGEQEFVAMLHSPADDAPFGAAIPNADAGEGFVDSGVSDAGVVTIRAPADFQVEDAIPAEDGTLAQGNIGAQALIVNTGDVEATQTVTYAVEDESGTEVANVSQEVTLDGEPVGEDGGFAQVPFNGINISESGTYTAVVSTANDTFTNNFTVIEEPAAGNVSAADQAVESSTVVEDPGAPGVVVEDVDANVDSVVLVANETDAIVGGQAFTAANLNGSSVSVPVQEGLPPGDHTAYVIPLATVSENGDLSSQQLSADSIDASLDTSAVTLYDGTVTFADEEVDEQTDSVTIDTADLLDGSGDNTEFVVVVHPFEDGNVGSAIGSSDPLTGANSDVPVTLETPISESGDYIAMVHEATAEGEPGTPVLHGSATGLVDNGVADDATITVNQPATAALSNLNIAGAGADATITEGDQTFVAVDLENTGDLEGTFDATLTIGESAVETQTVTLNGSGIATPTFSDVTGDLDAGEYDVTVDANGASISGTLTVEAAGGGGGGGGGGGAGPPSSPDPAFFEVSDLEPVDATVTQGETIDVAATITNTGGQGAQQTVEFRVDDSVVAEQDVLLRSNGGETTVTFEDIDTSDLEAGDYTHGIYAENDSQTGTLTIEAVDDGDGDGGTGDDGTDDGDDGTDDGDGGTDDGDDGGTDDGDDGTDDTTPGFGALVTLLALVLTAGFLTRRK